MNTTDLFLKGEVWRDVVGHEGLYQVSNFGRIKSLPKYLFGGSVISKEKIMKCSIGLKGYWVVNLKNKELSSNKVYKVHRLVAIAFIDNPENKETVNHINGIKTDNRLENLEWCTQKENVAHAHATGLFKIRQGEECPQTIFKKEDIYIIFKLYHEDKYTLQEIANMYNTSKSVIGKIKNRQSWKSITKYL